LKIEGPLKEARLIQRISRFSALVSLEGRLELVHVPNSGRLDELLTPGRGVLLRKAGTTFRKTGYDLLMVALPNGLVAVDARIPNLLVREALRKGGIPEFRGYRLIREEVRWDGSRVDFLLEGEGERLLLEVKSVTLVREGVALFPDAPTLRGTRHILDLIQAKMSGQGAGVVFVVQREDAHSFSPNFSTDPAFSEALLEAAVAGVKVLAYACKVGKKDVDLNKGLKLAF